MIDSSIYQQLRQPEPYNPLAELAQFEQLQSLQQQNKLGQLAFADRERGIADAAAQRTAVQGFGADTTANYNRLLGTGNLPAAQAYQKSLTDQAHVAGQTGKDVAATAGMQQDQAIKAHEQHLQKLSMVNDPQQYMQWINEGVSSGVFTPEKGQAGAQMVQKAAAQGPQALADLKRQAQASGASNLEQLKMKAAAEAAAEQQRQFGITSTETQRAHRASDATSRANSAASVGASYAHAAAAREQAGASRDQAQAVRDAANIQTGFKNEADLRKEFEGLSEVKNYKKAYPAFKAVSEAATRNTPQADINLIYGLAKLYDPDSVVREGEYATIANSQAIPEWLKGQAQRLVGGGKLTAETKKQILIEAKGRAEGYRGEVEKARASYQTIAVQRGMRPENVFQAMGDAPAGSAVAAPASSSAVDAALKKYGGP